MDLSFCYNSCRFSLSVVRYDLKIDLTFSEENVFVCSGAKKSSSMVTSVELIYSVFVNVFECFLMHFDCPFYLMQRLGCAEVFISCICSAATSFLGLKYSVCAYMNHYVTTSVLTHSREQREKIGFSSTTSSLPYR